MLIILNILLWRGSNSEKICFRNLPISVQEKNQIKTVFSLYYILDAIPKMKVFSWHKSHSALVVVAQICNSSTPGGWGGRSASLSPEQTWLSETLSQKLKKRKKKLKKAWRCCWMLRPWVRSLAQYTHTNSHSAIYSLSITFGE